MLRSKPFADAVTMVIAGELDHCAAPQIRHTLDELLRDPTVMHLILDLENLTFMDSSGIGVLLGRLRILQARGGKLSVKNMQPQVDKLFRLSGLDRVIGVVSDKPAYAATHRQASEKSSAPSEAAGLFHHKKGGRL